MRLFYIFCALLAVLLAFALLVSALVLLGTLAMRAVHGGRPRVLGVSHLSGLLLASVFLGFQRIVHPHVRHAIVQEFQDDEDAGDDVRPRALYRHQWRRIRRGEDLGELQLLQDEEDVPR